jgi:hypothetical protein
LSKINEGRTIEFNNHSYVMTGDVPGDGSETLTVVNERRIRFYSCSERDMN